MSVFLFLAIILMVSAAAVAVWRHLTRPPRQTHASEDQRDVSHVRLDTPAGPVTGQWRYNVRKIPRDKSGEDPAR